MQVNSNIDPDGYQLMVNGREKLVVECTREELVQEVCSQMEYIERMDTLCTAMRALLQSWRSGTDMPTELLQTILSDI
jgi:hypothetical protein